MTLQNHERPNTEIPDLTPEELDERNRVVEQTARIAKSLHDRALKNVDALQAYNTDRSKMAVYDNQLSLIKTDEYFVPESSTGVHAGSVPGYQGIYKNIRSGTKYLTITKLEAPKVELENETVELTTGQTRHLAAGILSNVRGELARREIEHGAKLAEEAAKRDDKRFDEFIEK